ncbi:hypothetical protein [Pedobacter frigiditerrae]|uniref:hypothetical protein n=1 Tax=Pedobacter frigiditerrae TaxID=2530452 RepID=UPI0029308E1B|nr:hypothetical protein [Pedobacter frigiditerrae]
MLVHDFLAVASNIGFVIVPAFLIGLVFLFLPQGRDTLLLVVENLSVFNVLPLLFLLIGVMIWSIISELGVRYAIYISDNSGKNLSDDRVRWRKTVQKLLAAIFLLWPSLIILVGLFWCMITATYMSTVTRFLSFFTCMLMVYWVMSVISNFYFRKFGNPKAGIYKSTKLGERSLPNTEQQYLRKLYGIYENYIFTLPKASSFQQPYKSDLGFFSAHFTEADKEFTNSFPQDDKVLRLMRRVPKSFTLTDAKDILNGRGELYKWTYCIPLSFYKGLHSQIKRFSILALLIFLIISFIPGDSPFFSIVGAPAIVCIAFACYTGMYVGLLYLDKALLKSWKLSLRFLLVIILIVCSIVNRDHPVRQLNEDVANRGTIVSQFDSWFTAYKKQIDQQNKEGKQATSYPVVFICSEGGALRTGAYTSLFLANLGERLENGHRVDFRGSVFAMSGVSGGAVGLGYYNAMMYENTGPKISNHSAIDLSKKFFLKDYLSPIIGKMLFGDFLALFLPWHINLLDRAVALESSWETAYHSVLGKKYNNVFSQEFVHPQLGNAKPLFMINTTETETGFQCLISNQSADGILFDNERDLLSKKLKNINYSTAINFSTRFPIFSPGAMVELKDGTRLHYLDGGYVENTGSASLLEVLELLKKESKNFALCSPVVINLLFGEDDVNKKRIGFGNEISEILNATLNTRYAKSKTARYKVKEFVNEIGGGLVIDAPLTPKEKNIPMNWVLSEQSMENINNDISHKLNNRSNEGILIKLFSTDLKYKKSEKAF